MKSKARAFNQSAQKQDPAVFDYVREVEQVWRDFPEVKDKIRFFDICAGTVREMLVYPGNPEKKEEIVAWAVEQDNLIRGIREMSAEKGSSFMPFLKAMLLHTSPHRYGFLDKAAAKAQETMFVFDHELGHALIPNATYAGGRNKAECIADAYAAIRHLQRYGADSALIDTLVSQRAFQFIFREDRMSHFTSPVIEQILARRHEIDWNALTPQETQKLAWRFAMKYAAYPLLLDTMDHEFKLLQGRIGDIRNGATLFLTQLADKVLSTDSADIFECGARALKLCFDGQVDGVALTGEYWDNLRQQLAEKQKIFAARDKLLFGLGAEDRPLQTAPAASDVIKFPGLKP